MLKTSLEMFKDGFVGGVAKYFFISNQWKTENFINNNWWHSALTTDWKKTKLGSANYHGISNENWVINLCHTEMGK